MKRVHVTVDSRRFVVDLDDGGQPQRVKERKLHGAPVEVWFYQAMWTARHKPMPRKGIILRAMDEAQKRQAS